MSFPPSEAQLPPAYRAAREELRARPRKWAVTGAAGFIGSHLVEELLRLGQAVAGFDNLTAGRASNLDAVLGEVGGAGAARFRFVEGDIRDPGACRAALAGAAFVLHHAALGSVPGSIDDPVGTHGVNVTGFLQVLAAAREAGAAGVVYASSSAVYGDDALLPKREESIGNLLSPYAASKRSNEIDAQVFRRCYGLPVTGLRYFNVFGSRQDPQGAYAAVIPRWISALCRGEAITINGDGTTTRDYCHVGNVVQANILAALRAGENAEPVLNIAGENRTSLTDLFRLLRRLLEARKPGFAAPDPAHGPFRQGDILHSAADISRARAALGYRPLRPMEKDLEATLSWYLENPA